LRVGNLADFLPVFRHIVFPLARRRDPSAAELQFDAAVSPATSAGTWKAHSFTPDSAALASVVEIRNGKLVLETNSPPPDPIGQTIRISDASVSLESQPLLITRYSCRFSRPQWVYELSLDGAVFSLEKIVAYILRKRGTVDRSGTLPLSRADEEPIVISEACAWNLFPLTENLIFDGVFGHTTLA